MEKLLAAATFILIVSPWSSAHAQMDAPPIGSSLPDVRLISVGNAVGVLQYCEANGLVSTTMTNAVLSGLTKKPGAQQSSDYMAGHNGQILPKGGKPFHISGASPYLQSRACDLVLTQAEKFP